MRLLLDTQVFIWWRENSPRLGADTREMIAGADLVFISVASAWEVAIKVGLGRLRIPGSFEQGVDESRFSKLPITFSHLPITFSHAAAVATLPAHHADPFDRMLIAQAQAEGLTLVTHDRRFEVYRLPIVWT